MLPALLAATAVTVLMLAALGLVIVRCRRRVPPDEALVRVGGRRTEVYIGRTAIVMPVVHRAIRLSLAPIRLALATTLRTEDLVPVDVALDVELRVEPVAEDVLAAWRLLGDRELDTPEARATVVTQLLQAKLVAILRGRLARRRQDALDRQALAAEVARELGDELRSSGLSVYGVTVTRLERAAAG